MTLTSTGSECKHLHTDMAKPRLQNDCHSSPEAGGVIALRERAAKATADFAGALPYAAVATARASAYAAAGSRPAAAPALPNLNSPTAAASSCDW